MKTNYSIISIFLLLFSSCVVNHPQIISRPDEILTNQSYIAIIESYVKPGDSYRSYLLTVKNKSNTNEIVYASRSSTELTNNETFIAYFGNPQFSPDGKGLFYSTVYTASSEAVHYIDLLSRTDRFVCHGMDYSIIDSGIYTGYVKILQRQPEKNGNWISGYSIFDISGKRISTELK
jgi:hypothetical protein